MNTDLLHALQKTTLDALRHEHLLDALVKLDELCAYASHPEAAEAVRTLKQDYAMLLGCMKSGMDDMGREGYFREFLRKAYNIYASVSQNAELECGNGYEAFLWKRLHQSPETLAEIYIPFVEGEGGAPASVSAILADPLASYQQLFDTIWTSAHWSEDERKLINHYVRDEEAPRINRLSIISATGLALLFCFDEQKALFLLSLIDENDVEISMRALVMTFLANAAYGDDHMRLYPAVQQQLAALRERACFKPLVMAVQKAVLAAKQSPELAREFEKRLPEQMEKAHDRMKDLPQEVTREEMQQYIEDNPKLRKFRNEMVGMMQDYIHMQNLGVDLSYHSFAHVHKILPFFTEAANWFCPFSFEHPLLFNINAATRFLSIIVHNKACDTDRYGMVFAMAPHLPEIHIVKQDAVTMEETRIEGDDVETFIEQLSEEMEQNSVEADKSLLAMSPERLYAHAVCCVQDCFRFFTIFKHECCTPNPFDEDMCLWKLDNVWPAFEAPEALRELADWLFELEMYHEALDFYEAMDPDVDILQRMGFAYEKLDAPQQAQDNYRQALAMKADDEWTQRQLLASYRNNGDLTLARDMLMKLLADSPDNYRYSRQLAEIYVRLEDYDEARKLYTKLDYLRPQHLPTQRALAWCYMALGNYDKASELYLDIIGQEEVCDEDFRNAGHCALLQHDIPTAVIYYQEFLKACGEERASSMLFATDERFLTERGADTLTRQLIIDLINI